MHMVAVLARHQEFGLPISGIGGITNWRDAVEFLLLGSSSVQVCTEVMLRGYRIVEDMIEGLDTYLDERGFSSVQQVVGKAVPQYSEWGNLDLNYDLVAKIDASACIGCQLCMVACHDGAHQCIHPAKDGSRVPLVDESECVGCNLCQIVCPVPGCISMVEVEDRLPPATWNEHVNSGAQLRAKKGVH
jgi:dihydropyrimidine dehydrogenase (NAD+) subunit PreA